MLSHFWLFLKNLFFRKSVFFFVIIIFQVGAFLYCLATVLFIGPDLTHCSVGESTLWQALEAWGRQNPIRSGLGASVVGGAIVEGMKVAGPAATAVTKGVIEHNSKPIEERAKVIGLVPRTPSQIGHGQDHFTGGFEHFSTSTYNKVSEDKNCGDKDSGDKDSGKGYFESGNRARSLMAVIGYLFFVMVFCGVFSVVIYTFFASLVSLFVSKFTSFIVVSFHYAVFEILCFNFLIHRSKLPLSVNQHISWSELYKIFLSKKQERKEIWSKLLSILTNLSWSQFFLISKKTGIVECDDPQKSSRSTVKSDIKNPLIENAGFWKCFSSWLAINLEIFCVYLQLFGFRLPVPLYILELRHILEGYKTAKTQTTAYGFTWEKGDVLTLDFLFFYNFSAWVMIIFLFLSVLTLLFIYLAIFYNLDPKDVVSQLRIKFFALFTKKKSIEELRFKCSDWFSKIKLIFQHLTKPTVFDLLLIVFVGSLIFYFCWLFAPAPYFPAASFPAQMNLIEVDTTLMEDSSKAVSTHNFDGVTDSIKVVSTHVDDFKNFLISPNTTVLALLVVFSLCVFLIGCFRSLSFSTGRGSNNNNGDNSVPSGYRLVSLLVSMIPLFWSCYLWFLYDGSGQPFQCVCYLNKLHLSFGIDSVGLSLMVLTSGLFPLCILLMRTFAGINTFLLLEIVILGSLTVLDLLGFYILFEASLILLFLLIARTPFGSVDAAYKIVLYTMAGSLVFLPVIFTIYSEFGSTNLLVLTTSLHNSLTSDRQTLLGWGMLAVFAVKIPLMPVHLWLPEAHVAAPTAGSVLLAGVLLKLGGIGFIRYLIPIVPSFVCSVFPLVVSMCLGSFLFSTLSTIRQVDLKKIVAYSSIAHMALVSLTIFSMSEFSSLASTFMMIAHGLVSPGLFLLVGLLYERTHTKFLLYFSGLGNHLPVFSCLFFLLTCANLSFPLFPNFVAEVLCLASLFAVHELYAFIFCVAQVLGAVYAFWSFNRIIHGQSNIAFNPKGAVVDLTRMEIAMITPLMICVLWLGLKPMA